MLRAQSQPILGDDKFEQFLGWLAESENGGNAFKSPALLVGAFVGWLVGTADGRMALRRLERWPTAKTLPFEDEGCPWEVVK